MKIKKLFKSVIAVSLCFILLSGTMATAIEPLAVLENFPSEDFIYPEGYTSEYEPSLYGEESLRFPDVEYAEDENEEEFGPPIAIGEYEKIYQTGEDTYRTVLSSIPNTFVDTDGEQKEIDNTLTPEGEVFTNTANDLSVEFPAEMERGEGVTLSRDGKTVKMIPLEGDYTRSAVKDNAILYNNVFDGIDVQYASYELGLKEDIILNRYTERNSFQYELETGGLIPRLEDGVINLYTLFGSEPEFSITAPLMTDAEGNISRGLKLSLKSSFGHHVVTVEADSEWIADPARVFPVKIDPNVTVDSADMEAMSVAEKRPVRDTQFGYVGYIRNGDIDYDGPEIDFGTSRLFIKTKDEYVLDIPKGAFIESAVLNITQYTNYGGGSGRKSYFTCHQVKDPWVCDPYVFDWDAASNLNFASSSPTVSEASLEPPYNDPKTHTFDISSYVEDWINFPENNHGLMIKDSGYPGTPEDPSDPPLPGEIDATCGEVFYNPSYAVGSIKSKYYPSIYIDWQEVNRAEDIPLNDTTINVRPIVTSTNKGALAVRGVFADGSAKPGADVTYHLNDDSKDISGTVRAQPLNWFPDSTLMDLYFPDEGTKRYRSRISNWQTTTTSMFTDFVLRREKSSDM